MSRPESQLTDVLRQRIIAGLKDLLEKKHLYQSVVISTQGLDEIIWNAADEHKREIRRAGPTTKYSNPEESGKSLSELLNKKLLRILNSPWDFDPEINSYPGAPPVGVYDQFPSIPLPSIRVSCSSDVCKGSIQPHNSGYPGLQRGLCSDSLSQPPAIIEIFSVPFQCQNCKSEPLIFLVKRETLKLTLVGRSQFPEVSIPEFIPKAQRKFYRNAIIADQTSFTLAGALYLRIVIEQYFHAVIPEEKIKAIRGNPTGEELAELYAKTLPKNFPDSFPSLKKAYDDLSKIVHSGKEDDDAKKLFVTIRNGVDGHFKALQLFKEMPAQ